MSEYNENVHFTSGKKQLLVVEDELINREILRAILEDTYEPIFAATGEEAIQTLKDHTDTLSLVLLDLNLPDMHGLDVLRRIRANDKYSRLPVIVMTSEKDAEVECLNLGAIDFIPKPYPQPKVILARINRTIELSEDRDLIRWTERDQLTGLYNREFFYRYAAQFDTFRKDTPTDAIVVDINHFHMINERYGKTFGDEVLVKVGEKLRHAVMNDDGIVCRRSADTFLIYCPHRTDYNDILEEASVDLGNNAVIRLRMGVYANTDKTIDMERRFDRAKSAADTVKNNYTKAVGIYDNSLHEAELYMEQLLEDFPKAIREKQFTVFYQPKFDVRSETPRLNSAEALIRWRHPELGMISPGTFIPLFEDNGLIGEMDAYVWRETVRQIREWKDRLGITIPVSVNVSRVEMYDPDLVEQFEGLIREFHLSHNDLLLEITESAYTEDSQQIIQVVSELRKRGFRIEMDDFGSGYSSLNMISSLPIDALKLDMQFIRTAFRERKDTRLLEVVISLAEMLGVPTIAEGVETAEQMFTLKTMGCDIVQGYYFSKPLPADEFEAFIKNVDIAEGGIPKKARQKGKRDMLTYDALHDPVTGMYNHSAFDILFHDSDKDHIAVFLANINDYELILRDYGRAKTNEAVKMAADVLRENFRNVDDICRLKEDEFVIIMTRVTGAMHEMAIDKVELINRELQNVDTAIPVSMCFGIAFSDREDPHGDIFEDADEALTRAKAARADSCVY